MVSMLMTENMAMTTTPEQLLPRAFPPEDIDFTPVVNKCKLIIHEARIIRVRLKQHCTLANHAHRDGLW